jgi:hypothetical protein
MLTMLPGISTAFGKILVPQTIILAVQILLGIASRDHPNWRFVARKITELQ